MFNRKWSRFLIPVLVTAPLGWALEPSDPGEQWAQASQAEKIRLSAVLARELGGSAWKYVRCLDSIFVNTTYEKTTTIIIAAAEQCYREEPPSQ